MTRLFRFWGALAAGLAAPWLVSPAYAANEPAPAPPAALPSAPSAPDATAPPVPLAAPEAAVAPAAAPGAPEPTAAVAPSKPSVAARTRAARPASLKAQARSQDDYRGPPLLLGNGRKVKVGAYGGIGGAYTRFMGRDSGLMSLEAALLLDHRLSLGVAAYGFTRTPRGPAAADGTKQEFGAGYLGFAARYSVLGSLPVYPTFGLVLGAGAINLHHDHGWNDESDWDDGFRALDHDDHDDHDEWDRGLFDPFLFVQPELALNANATRWLRFGATLGYRFTSGVGRFGLENSDLNGIVAGANIQLGWF